MKRQRTEQLRIMAAALRRKLTELDRLDAETDVAGWLLSHGPDVVEALRRIDAGTYGTCIDCGEDIPLIRLQARPEATRCVHCQTRHERHSEPALRVRLAS
jgi:DnaK suppressor protein